MISKFHRYTFLAALLCISSQAGAGLFSDDEARAQIQQIETRLTQVDELLAKHDLSEKKQARTILDLQSLIEAQNAEIRTLRGLNEELAHNLQGIEKRQRDINVDLDARLRKQETIEHNGADKTNGTASNDAASAETRAFETAYGFYKTEHYQNAAAAFQEFLRNFPQTTHAADVYYWLGFSQYVLKDYKGSLLSYKKLSTQFDTHPKLADALLNMADCQMELKDKAAAKLTLKLIVSKFPNSDAAKDAKKQLAQLK